MIPENIPSTRLAQVRSKRYSRFVFYQPLYQYADSLKQPVSDFNFRSRRNIDSREHSEHQTRTGKGKATTMLLFLLLLLLPLLSLRICALGPHYQLSLPRWTVKVLEPKFNSGGMKQNTIGLRIFVMVHGYSRSINGKMHSSYKYLSEKLKWNTIGLRICVMVTLEV